MGIPGSPERDAWNRRRRELNAMRRENSGKPLVPCKICGVPLRIIGKHLKLMHGITFREYALRFLRQAEKTAASDLIEFNRTKDSSHLKAFSQTEEFKSAAGERAKSPEVRAAVSEAKRARALREESKQAIGEGNERYRTSDKYQKQLLRVQEKNERSGRRATRICLQCKAVYGTKSSQRQFFCSAACYHESRR